MDENIKKILDYESLMFDVGTDDDILAIAQNRIVTKPADFNLRKGPRSSDGYLHPIAGGLYDGRIFGSIYENRCNCGEVTDVGLPCIQCGTTIFDPTERMIRYGAIDLGYLYTTPVKVGALLKLLRAHFHIRVDINDKLLAEKWDLTRDYKIMTLLYFCQVNYDEKSNSIIFTDTLDDVNKLSLEGVLAIIKNYKPDLEVEFKKYVNRYIPVIPAIMRKVKFCIINGNKKLELPKSTAYYRSIIIAAAECKKVVETSTDLYQIGSHLANLRLYAGKVMIKMSGFLKSSKATFFRRDYKINSAHSGRAVIAGDPELPVDTIKIPRALAYEMYKKKFLKYLNANCGVPKEELAKLYNEAGPEVMKYFDEFCKSKVVIINRAPTIHSQNFQVYKLQLSEDYGIHFPLLTTASQNADFDGDAVMFYDVPDEFSEYMLERCSPATYTNYVSDGSPILVARHEILYGLTIASKMIETSEPRVFLNKEEAYEAFDNDEIWVYDVIQIGDITTTYGRQKLADIFRIPDLHDVIGDNPINAKNIVAIYSIINGYKPEDRVKVLDEMQKFALEVVTLEGVTSIDCKHLYYDVPDDYREEIKAVLDSDAPESDKIREAEGIHARMVNDLMSDPEFQPTIQRVIEGNRGKISAIVSMLVPSFYVDRKGKLQFATHSLVEGLDEQELLAHSASNRESLLIKANMVPFSGFFNRQLKEAGSKIIMLEGKTDPDNEGLEIPASAAEGRYGLDGKIYGKSDSKKLVKVKSILTSKLPYATADMFNSKMNFTYDLDGRCFIGTDWMTAFGSDITQSGLSLKHQTTSRFVEDTNKLIAPCDTEVEYTEDKIILKATGQEYILPTKWSTKGPGFYKKGEIIGEVNNYVTFTIVVQSLVELLKASGSLNNRDMNNDIKFSRCFNHSKPAKVEYSNGTIKVGKISWKRDSRFVFLPIGTEVAPYERFCNGVQDMQSLNKSSLTTRYNIFRNVILELRKVNDCIIEMLYRIMTRGTSSYEGLQRANVRGNTSAVSAIGFGYTNDAVKRIVSGGLKINSSDPMSEIIFTPQFFNMLNLIQSKR